MVKTNHWFFVSLYNSYSNGGGTFTAKIAIHGPWANESSGPRIFRNINVSNHQRLLFTPRFFCSCLEPSFRGIRQRGWVNLSAMAWGKREGMELMRWIRCTRSYLISLPTTSILIATSILEVNKNFMFQLQYQVETALRCMYWHPDFYPNTWEPDIRGICSFCDLQKKFGKVLEMVYLVCWSTRGWANLVVVCWVR